jgi:hypothetical protein
LPERRTGCAEGRRRRVGSRIRRRRERRNTRRYIARSARGECVTMLVLKSLFSFALFTFAFTLPLSVAQASWGWHASAGASGVN